MKSSFIFFTLLWAGRDSEGWSVCVLVCPDFGDSRARRQHQPHQPGGSAGDAAGGGGHVQSSRWSPLTHWLSSVAQLGL